MTDSLTTRAEETLSLEERVRLIAGADFWSTVEDARVGLRRLVLSDGPSGVRGPVYDERTPSVCAPSGSAVAASWDRDIARRVGALVGDEAVRVGVHVVLGPVLNIPRSPLGGRAFECFSEDPLLSGELGAAWIHGLQSRGVAASPKHFVANDSETARRTVNCVVDSRALREIYLLPFELAVRDGCWAMMAAYNRVNGTACSEHMDLLWDVLKDEWGWDGVVVSDWFGAEDTVACARAGLDLEMPGPAQCFGDALVAAVRDGRVDEAVVDDKIDRLRRLSARIGAHAPGDAVEPQSVLRDAAAASFVLLKNDNGLLPLEKRSVKRVAVIGAHAATPTLQGGGAATVAVGHVTTPLDAIRAALGDSVQVDYEPGCQLGPTLTGFDGIRVRATDGSDAPGMTVEYLVEGGEETELLASENRDASFFWFIGSPYVGSATRVRLSGKVANDQGGDFEIGIRATGPVRMTLGGTSVLETTTATNDAPDIMGRVFASGDARTVVHLDAGAESLLTVELEIDPLALNMIDIGARPAAADDALERAVAAAAEADLVVLMLGTTNDLESEGLDRETTLLPADQRELAERVLAASSRSVVAINAGAAVDLECVRDADAILYLWLSGQELGPALADVITGAREPGGRLPITLAADRDYPVRSTEPDRAGRLLYSEGVFVGYRWFDEVRRDPLYCFGHGLGYTTFEYERIHVLADDPGRPCRVEVTVRNVGERRGKEVVQLYVSDPEASVPRPPTELKAFEALELDPGEERTVTFDLDARSFAHWDLPARGWRVREGTYVVRAGRSSRDLPLTAQIDVAGAFEPVPQQSPPRP